MNVLVLEMICIIVLICAAVFVLLSVASSMWSQKNEH